MLRLELRGELVERMVPALQKAGKNEIGGILMAEHVGHNEFVVRDLTIHSRGTIATFVRGVKEAVRGLASFFKETRRDYRRFNYIGEWHSHPSFGLHPSGRDRRTMQEIVTDKGTRPQFLVLMIVKLDEQGALQGAVFTYLPDGSENLSTLAIELSD